MLNSHKWFLEIIQNIDGTYCVNMAINGIPVDKLPEYVDYNTLKEGIKERTSIIIPNRNQLIFQQYKGKKYAYVDATQPCKRGSIVTLKEVLNGHKPDFS